MTTVIHTSKFQNIRIQPEKVFTFPQGLIGFESHRDFVLIDRTNKNQFLWLQSLTHPNLCFLLIEPARVVDFFSPVLSQETRSFLEAGSESEITFLSLVSVDESHENISINLKSPIVLNLAKRIGLQVVLEEDHYPVRYLVKNLLALDAQPKILESRVIKTG